MAWNIGVLCIKAGKNKIEDIFDIFYKEKENLFFEEVASCSMDKALGITSYKEWIIIVDNQGRFIFNEPFPLKISKQYKIKTFWISEGMIYRDYHYGFFKKGGIKNEYKGKKGGTKYLKEHNIKPLDEWGETMIFQVIENEIFN